MLYLSRVDEPGTDSFKTCGLRTAHGKISVEILKLLKGFATALIKVSYKQIARKDTC